jgi:B9 domain-containing protein 2
MSFSAFSLLPPTHTGAFVGGSVQLRSVDLVYSPADRYRLRTVAAGSVRVHLGIMLRNFDKYGVDM